MVSFLIHVVAFAALDIGSFSTVETQDSNPSRHLTATTSSVTSPLPVALVSTVRQQTVVLHAADFTATSVTSPLLTASVGVFAKAVTPATSAADFTIMTSSLAIAPVAAFTMSFAIGST